MKTFLLVLLIINTFFFNISPSSFIGGACMAYVKQGFENGQLFQAENLIKIENGILDQEESLSIVTNNLETIQVALDNVAKKTQEIELLANTNTKDIQEVDKKIAQTQEDVENIQPELKLVKSQVASNNAQITSLENQLNAISNTTNEVSEVASSAKVTANEALQKSNEALNKINNLPDLEQYGEIITVAKEGAKHATINDAILEAKTKLTENPWQRILILILDCNIYDEEITLLSNPGIDMAGFGAIIRHNSAYPHAPLYTTGRGTFTGLIFENYNQTTGDTPSYALHFDYNNEGASASGETKFINCQFTAINSHSVGIGMGPDVNLFFENCFFYSTTHSGCYIHNSPFEAQNQIARFSNCQFHSNATNWPAFLVEDAQGITKSTSFASFYLHNCSFIPVFPVTQYKLLNSIEDKGTQYSHKCLLNTNNLHFDVQGNTLPGYQPLTAVVEVDDTDSSSISAKIDTNTNKFYYTGISDNNGRISIPCPFINSELLDLIIIECSSDTEVITDFTVLNQGSTVLLQNQNYPKTMLYFTLQWLPKDVSFPVEATTLKP